MTSAQNTESPLWNLCPLELRIAFGGLCLNALGKFRPANDDRRGFVVLHAALQPPGEVAETDVTENLVARVAYKHLPRGLAPPDAEIRYRVQISGHFLLLFGDGNHALGSRIGFKYALVKTLRNAHQPTSLVSL